MIHQQAKGYHGQDWIGTLFRDLDFEVQCLHSRDSSLNASHAHKIFPMQNTSETDDREDETLFSALYWNSSSAQTIASSSLLGSRMLELKTVVKNHLVRWSPLHSCAKAFPDLPRLLLSKCCGDNHRKAGSINHGHCIPSDTIITSHLPGILEDLALRAFTIRCHNLPSQRSTKILLIPSNYSRTSRWHHLLNHRH